LKIIKVSILAAISGAIGGVIGIFAAILIVSEMEGAKDFFSKPWNNEGSSWWLMMIQCCMPVSAMVGGIIGGVFSVFGGVILEALFLYPVGFDTDAILEPQTFYKRFKVKVLYGVISGAVAGFIVGFIGSFYTFLY